MMYGIRSARGAVMILEKAQYQKKVTKHVGDAETSCVGITAIEH